MTVVRRFASLSAAALVATALLAAVPGAAADVIDVSLVNYGQIDDSEIYKADLESIGVGREISGNDVLPLDIFVLQPSPLTFRVLASTPLRRDPTIRTYSFHVDGTGYAVPQMGLTRSARC